MTAAAEMLHMRGILSTCSECIHLRPYSNNHSSCIHSASYTADLHPVTTMALLRNSRRLIASTVPQTLISTRGMTDKPTTSTSSPVPSNVAPAKAEEWQEVVDEATGGTYYWNEKTGGWLAGRARPKGCGAPRARMLTACTCTSARAHAGETTDIGEPRPRTRFRQNHSRHESETGSPFQEQWKEPPQRDMTQACGCGGVPSGLRRRHDRHREACAVQCMPGLACHKQGHGSTLGHGRQAEHPASACRAHQMGEGGLPCVPRCRCTR